MRIKADIKKLRTGLGVVLFSSALLQAWTTQGTEINAVCEQGLPEGAEFLHGFYTPLKGSRDPFGVFGMVYAHPDFPSVEIFPINESYPEISVVYRSDFDE